jgi:L-ascorbate metabolism protein UlaG (beta-lactamase superfamily)
MNIKITHIETACILLEINGFKILTDPTLDNAGKLYYHGFGTFSRKTDNPALQVADLKNIDLILLSHHQHKDNFDINGKKFALTVSKIISTKQASKAIQGITGLHNWESHKIETIKLTNLTITATPAQHHPWWVPGFFAGKVIGFVIAFEEQENGVIYISGDTVYFKGIDEVARQFKIDIGIFHVGSVQFRYLTGFGQYTMDSKDLMKAVKVLNPNRIIPVHYKGWTHFKEKETILKRIIATNDKINSKTIFLKPGIRTTVPLMENK